MGIIQYIHELDHTFHSAVSWVGRSLRIHPVSGAGPFGCRLADDISRGARLVGHLDDNPAHSPHSYLADYDYHVRYIRIHSQRTIVLDARGDCPWVRCEWLLGGARWCACSLGHLMAN